MKTTAKVMCGLALAAGSLAGAATPLRAPAPVASAPSTGPISGPIYRPESYGAGADAPAAVNVAAIRAALALAASTEGGTVRFAPGVTYQLGRIGAGQTLFDVDGSRGLQLVGQGTVFATAGAPGGTQVVFGVVNPHNVRVEGVRNEDASYDPVALPGQPSGTVFLNFSEDRTTTALGNITLRSVAARHTGRLVSFTGKPGAAPSAAYRIRGVSFEGDSWVDDVYYGINCSENGDGLTGRLRSTNAVRAYFGFGNQDVDLYLTVGGRSPGGTNGYLDIKRQRLPTRNIRLVVDTDGPVDFTNGSVLARLENQSIDPVAFPAARNPLENVELVLNAHDVAGNVPFIEVADVDGDAQGAVVRHVRLLGTGPATATGMARFAVLSAFRQPVDVAMSPGWYQNYRRYPPATGTASRWFTVQALP